MKKKNLRNIIFPALLISFIFSAFSTSGLYFRTEGFMGKSAISKDKKAEAGKVHFILIEDVGNVVEKKMYVHDAVGMLK